MSVWYDFDTMTSAPLATCPPRQWCVHSVMNLFRRPCVCVCVCVFVPQSFWFRWKLRKRRNCKLSSKSKCSYRAHVALRLNSQKGSAGEVRHHKLPGGSGLGHQLQDPFLRMSTLILSCSARHWKVFSATNPMFNRQFCREKIQPNYRGPRFLLFIPQSFKPPRTRLNGFRPTSSWTSSIWFVILGAAHVVTWILPIHGSWGDYKKRLAWMVFSLHDPREIWWTCDKQFCTNDSSPLQEAWHQWNWCQGNTRPHRIPGPCNIALRTDWHWLTTHRFPALRCAHVVQSS